MADLARNLPDDDATPSFRPGPQWTPDLDRVDDDEVQFFPFVHQSDDFAMGFEAGEFFCAVRDGVSGIEGNFFERNKGELLRIAARFGYRLLVWTTNEDGLAFARFVRACAVLLFLDYTNLVDFGII